MEAHVYAFVCVCASHLMCARAYVINDVLVNDVPFSIFLYSRNNLRRKSHAIQDGLKGTPLILLRSSFKRCVGYLYLEGPTAVTS